MLATLREFASLAEHFDDGALLGSRQNDECQIDSIGQTWAVVR
jgi:cellobiose phosphorylase